MSKGEGEHWLLNSDSKPKPAFLSETHTAHVFLQAQEFMHQN